MRKYIITVFIMLCMVACPVFAVTYNYNTSTFKLSYSDPSSTSIKSSVSVPSSNTNSVKGCSGVRDAGAVCGTYKKGSTSTGTMTGMSTEAFDNHVHYYLNSGNPGVMQMVKYQQ